jgi:hypothetical protein
VDFWQGALGMAQCRALDHAWRLPCPFSLVPFHFLLDMFSGSATNVDVTCAGMLRPAPKDCAGASSLQLRRDPDRGLWKSPPASSSRRRNCDATTGS